jgi:hypothetical protein
MPPSAVLSPGVMGCKGVLLTTRPKLRVEVEKCGPIYPRPQYVIRGVVNDWVKHKGILYPYLP